MDQLRQKPLTATSDLRRLIVGLALPILLFSGCSTDRSGPVSVAQIAEEEGPDQESWNVEYYLGEEGTRRAVLRAAHMARYESTDSVVVVMDGTDDQPVRVEVFGPDGEKSDVTARQIEFLEKRRVYLLTGAVVVRTSSGRTLRTEALTWLETEARLTADGFVQIESETENLRGYGLDADEMLDSFTLHNVTGRKYIEDE